MRSFLCAGLFLILLSLIPSCGQRADEHLDASWLSEYLSSQRLKQDGFLDLHEAVACFRRTRKIDNVTLSRLSAAGQSIEWSGHPDMQRVWPSHEVMSDRLINGHLEVDYETLIGLVKELSSYAEHAKTVDDLESANSVAIIMIRLGYQISRGREDNVIGTLRIALWKEGVAILGQTGKIGDSQKAAIVAECDDDLEWIRNRDDTRLYGIRERPKHRL